MIPGFLRPDTRKWPSGDGKQIAVLNTTARDLSAHLGAEVFNGEDSLGLTREIGVQLRSGRLVLFLEHENAPDLGVNLLVDRADSTGDALAELRELSPFISDRLGWVASE
jgi:hypothetical protein